MIDTENLRVTDQRTLMGRYNSNRVAQGLCYVQCKPEGGGLATVHR